MHFITFCLFGPYFGLLSSVAAVGRSVGRSQEKNGKISRGEMQVALAQIGVSQDEIERLFASLDVVSLVSAVCC